MKLGEQRRLLSRVEKRCLQSCNRWWLFYLDVARKGAHKLAYGQQLAAERQLLVQGGTL